MTSINCNLLKVTDAIRNAFSVVLPLPASDTIQSQRVRLMNPQLLLRARTLLSHRILHNYADQTPGFVTHCKRWSNSSFLRHSFRDDSVMSTDTNALLLQTTLKCGNVPDALNPVAAFHKSHDSVTTRSRDASTSAPELGQLQLLAGEWQGIAHIADHLRSSEDEASLRGCLSALALVRDKLLPRGEEDEGCIYDGMGSESEFQVLPVILRCGGEAEGESLHTAAVQALGVGADLVEKSPPAKEFSDCKEFCRYLESDVLKLPQRQADSSRLRMGEAVHQLFEESDLSIGPCMQLVVGNEGLTPPTLVFWLGRCADKPYMVGLMTAVVWT